MTKSDSGSVFAKTFWHEIVVGVEYVGAAMLWTFITSGFAQWAGLVVLLIARASAVAVTAKYTVTD